MSEATLTPPRPALAGKRALITGGTRGVGRASVLAFARAGAGVVTCHHRPGTDAEELGRELAGLGAEHRVVRADVTDPAAVRELIDTCEQALGGLDVVVNNVGVDGVVSFEEMSLADWNQIMDANLTSAFLISQAALRLLSPGGSIINIGASVALRGRSNGVHYTASKAALIGLTRSLTKELGTRGIRVNTIAPGLIETEPDAGLPPQVAERIRALTALRRLGTPDDVAGAAVYLASDASRYVTGVTLNVDGGM